MVRLGLVDTVMVCESLYLSNQNESSINPSAELSLAD